MTLDLFPIVVSKQCRTNLPSTDASATSLTLFTVG